MYSVCTRIEIIIFNKRGKKLPNPFYKLPHNVLCVAALRCPTALAGTGNTLEPWVGGRGGLGPAELGLGLPAQQMYPGDTVQPFGELQRDPSGDGDPSAAHAVQASQ